jgi:hypothetical protein
MKRLELTGKIFGYVKILGFSHVNENWLRSFWLHTLYVLKIAFTRCEVCGVLGASSCSIAQCTKLCGDCQLEVHRRLDARWQK